MTKSGKAVHLQNQISPTLGKRLGLTRHRSSKSEDMAADGQRSEAVTEAKQRESGVRGGTRVVGDELHMNIASSLNRIEAEVLHVMVEAVKMSKSNTVVRVAGGWVRDKLLNLEVKFGDVRYSEACSFVINLDGVSLSVLTISLQPHYLTYGRTSRNTLKNGTLMAHQRPIIRAYDYDTLNCAGLDEH